jgi:hypothetical protein
VNVRHRLARANRDAGAHGPERRRAAGHHAPIVLQRIDERRRQHDHVARHAGEKLFAQSADGAERAVDGGAGLGRERRLDRRDEPFRRARAEHRQRHRRFAIDPASRRRS